ncbi:MAG: RNA polymerase subunit sigma, partial [Gammaproteobacteria bacterium]|nr:RNA polymerase subunit sigma [Gammaproteobacteria bacterium]
RQPICVSADDIWPLGEATEGSPELDDSAEQSALMSRIEQLLERLPAAQQAVINQVYVLDFTHEEAARRLGIPLGTLKSRLRLGLDKLRYLAGAEK